MEITPERVREIMKVAQDPVSLETPIGEEEDSHLGDFIEDQGALAPSDAASHQLLKEQVEDVLDSLTRSRAPGAAAALRPGRRPPAHAGRGRPRVRRHPRAHPPDRGEGAPQAAPPHPLQEAQRLPGVVAQGDQVGPTHAASDER